jgi:hypothetical protein
MESFLGPMTAITAAGIPPMGSVFNAVPSAGYLLGRDALRILPPVRSKPARRWSVRDDSAASGAMPCGCGA